VRRGSETLAAALAALLLAAGLAACGGGNDTSTKTSASAAGSTGKEREAQPQSNGSGPDKSKTTGSGGTVEADGDDEAAEFKPKPHHDSGGGSTQYKLRGGDNSVQEFGEEAGESEFEAAAAALHNFLDARARGNWDATCRYMSKSTVESVEKLAAQGKGGETSCGAVLGNLVNPNARQSMREEAAKADIGSMRTEGDQAFLIYTAVDDTILAMPMVHEGGEWRVGGLAGTPLN
jgi:hypothetical protein